MTININKPSGKTVAIIAVVAIVFLAAIATVILTPRQGADGAMALAPAAPNPDSAAVSSSPQAKAASAASPDTQQAPSTAQLSSDFAAQFEDEAIAIYGAEGASAASASARPVAAVQPPTITGAPQPRLHTAASAATPSDALEPGVRLAPPAPRPDLKVMLVKAIEQTESAARLIRVEERVIALSVQMDDLSAKVDILLARSAGDAPQEERVNGLSAGVPEMDASAVIAGEPTAAAADSEASNPASPAQEANSSNRNLDVRSGATDVDEPEDKPAPGASTERADMPPPIAPSRPTQGATAATSSSIQSLRLTERGARQTIATFRLSGNAQPRTRVINGADVGWSETKNWVAVDLYGTDTVTGMPSATGIVRDVTLGRHEGFERFLFETSANAELDAAISKQPGVVTVTLTREVVGPAPSYAPQPAPARVVRRPAPAVPAAPAPSRMANMPVWVVRAISDDAAVIYDLRTQQLLSLRLGSRVPVWGVVTGFDAGARTVYTTNGVINASSSRLN